MNRPRFLHQSHNVSVLLYHLVCPVKYRRVVFDTSVDVALKDACMEVALRREIIFLELGTDRDHVHFLLQSVPSYSPSTIVRVVKSLTAKEIFRRCPEVKKQLWGGKFWSEGYFIASVVQHASAETIANYVREQGQHAGQASQYQKLHQQQLELFHDYQGNRIRNFEHKSSQNRGWHCEWSPMIRRAECRSLAVFPHLRRFFDGIFPF